MMQTLHPRSHLLHFLELTEVADSLPLKLQKIQGDMTHEHKQGDRSISIILEPMLFHMSSMVSSSVLLLLVQPFASFLFLLLSQVVSTFLADRCGLCDFSFSRLAFSSFLVFVLCIVFLIQPFDSLAIYSWCP